MCDLDYPISRVSFVKAAGAAAGIGSLAPAAAFAEQPTFVAQAGPRAPLKVRWLGGGVTEISTPDSKQILLVDAWIWNNSGYGQFNLQKPPELASAAAYADHIASRKPDGVLVLLTHDHGDHIGDYFELLRVLSDRKINVKTMGQSDMMRAALLPKFKDAGLDNTAIVLNNGAGGNIGGTAVHAGMRATVVPAVHSTLSGVPAVGFVAQIGGQTVYGSGDTDLFGDMALIGRRYKPDLALVCIGNGAFTMGPLDAAEAERDPGALRAQPAGLGAHRRRDISRRSGARRSANARHRDATRELDSDHVRAGPYRETAAAPALQTTASCDPKAPLQPIAPISLPSTMIGRPPGEAER